MKHEPLFTFGEDDQHELIEATCVACRCDFMFIDEAEAISLPICLVCDKALKDCKLDFDINEER
ncbi:MAG TPA: hypothetical protein DEB70_12215 [Planctomycetaceae bacterium]|nr:hypothetical protein [Planctomycetaceae bacterium]